jgi:hypothetical protein
MTMNPVIPAFPRFPEEAEIIGRLLAGYGEVEFELCHCVSQVIDDLDLAIKAMFRSRGEKQRLDVADAIGRKPYVGLGLENEFSEAIGGAHFCRKVRNQYAHCNWHDDQTGKLGFVNLEEISEPNTEITDLSGLTIRHLDTPLLEQQEAYFWFVIQSLTYLNYEGRKRAGKLTTQPVPVPSRVARPPFTL